MAILVVTLCIISMIIGGAIAWGCLSHNYHWKCHKLKSDIRHLEFNLRVYQSELRYVNDRLLRHQSHAAYFATKGWENYQGVKLWT